MYQNTSYEEHESTNLQHKRKDFIRRELSALIGLQIFKVPTLGVKIELNQVTLRKTWLRFGLQTVSE
jgi:hypothetical protein